jgi:cyclic lactone autoinducer peptide
VPSFIIMMATLSANMTCEGIWYQPVVPARLRKG